MDRQTRPKTIVFVWSLWAEATNNMIFPKQCGINSYSLALVTLTVRQGYRYCIGVHHCPLLPTFGLLIAYTCCYFCPTWYFDLFAMGNIFLIVVASCHHLVAQFVGNTYACKQVSWKTTGPIWLLLISKVFGMATD